MTHVVLLGDSIFDNATYVPGGPDVVQQLRGVLPSGGRATLLAVDGSVTESVHRQLQRVPADATHLVISVGGNDALRSVNVLSQPVTSVAEALTLMADVRDAFAVHYRTLIEATLRLNRPTAICTIYDPRFPDSKQRRFASVGLTMFNDVITREQSRLGLPLIDLRLIANEDADFANAIEPSVHGGEKIAAAIAKLVGGAVPAGSSTTQN